MPIELKFQKYNAGLTGQPPLIELLPYIPPIWRQSIQQLNMDSLTWMPYLTEVLHSGLPSLRTVRLPSSEAITRFWLFHAGNNQSSTFTKARFNSSDQRINLGQRTSLEQSCRRRLMADLNQSDYYHNSHIPVDLVTVVTAGHFCLRQVCLRHRSPQLRCVHKPWSMENHVMVSHRRVDLG